MKVREVWKALPLAVSAMIVPRGGCMGGFYCATSSSGTVEITAGESSGGATIVAEFAVTAGTFYPMPFDCPQGAYATLTDCTGTFAVDAV